MRTVPTEMDLTYKRRFSDLKIPEAYECVLRRTCTVATIG